MKKKWTVREQERQKHVSQNKKQVENLKHEVQDIMWKNRTKKDRDRDWKKHFSLSNRDLAHESNMSIIGEPERENIKWWREKYQRINTRRCVSNEKYASLVEKAHLKKWPKARHIVGGRKECCDKKKFLTVSKEKKQIGHIQKIWNQIALTLFNSHRDS